MKQALEKMRSEVLVLAGKYSDPKRGRELEQVFAILEKELESNQLQIQRIMPLLRGIMTAQPGSAKSVNGFLKNPKIASAINAGGGYNLE